MSILRRRMLYAHAALTGGGGGGGGFSPSGLSGLIGWYDAQYSGGVLNTGTGIQATNSQAANTFVDRSGAGNDLTDVTGQPPTFFTAGLTGSKPSVTFTAAGPTSLRKASYAIGTGNTFSLFIVCQMLTGTQTFGRLVSYAKSAGGASFDNVGSAAFVLRGGGANQISDYSNNSQGTLVSVSLATTIRVGIIYDGSNRTMYLNGVAQTPVAQSNTPWVSGGVFQIGNEVFSTVSWDGPVGELIASTADLTSQVSSIDSYFTGRW